MILDATDVGELVASLLARNHKGRVSRVFRNSAYILVGDELVLLLRGWLRSPINVNLTAPEDFEKLFAVGEECALSEGRIALGAVTVRTKRAKVYRGSLEGASSAPQVSAPALAKGVRALRLLFAGAHSDLDLFSGAPFRRFADSVLRPLARGDLSEARSFHNYLPLLGLGGGFTPSGDDFVGGFSATFNHHARAIREAEVIFSTEELAGRTVPESAALIRYAQRGHVDEEMGHLIVSAFGGRRGRFFSDLLQVAKRGHTSGIDMSTGVLLAAAAIRDRSTGEGALRNCLEEI